MFQCELWNTVNVTRFEAENPHWQSSLTSGLGTWVVMKSYGRSHVPPHPNLKQNNKKKTNTQFFYIIPALQNP